MRALASDTTRALAEPLQALSANWTIQPAGWRAGTRRHLNVRDRIAAFLPHW